MQCRVGRDEPAVQPRPTLVIMTLRRTAAWAGALALLVVSYRRWSSSTTSATGEVLEPAEVQELYDGIAGF